MKSKLTVALVVAALIGGLAYWLGYRQGSITYYTRLSQNYEDQVQERWCENGQHQARLCLSALTNLDAGNQAQARAVLQRHLSEGVARLVSTWENPQGYQFSARQVLLLRAARDYRQHHPWTNDEPRQLECVEKAFKMLDTPAQVKLLERIDNMQRGLTPDGRQPLR